MATSPKTRVSTRAGGPPRAKSKITVPGNRGVKVTRACTILKPASELYRFWRDEENLLRIIKHPASIEKISAVESRWTVSAPAGDRQVSWTSLIINDEPDRLIAWRSAEGAEVPNAGSVRFEPAPGGDGTEVTVAFEYNPPAGKLGAWLAKLSGEEGGQQVADALRRFKALMEAGEIPTIDGQPVGKPQKSKRSS
jgi:uncharacterized membrane protein